MRLRISFFKNIFASRKPYQFMRALNQSAGLLKGSPEQYWFKHVFDDTEKHRSYLESIGLADRAACFKIQEFKVQNKLSESIDITRFNSSMALPDLVIKFDSKEKHTLLDSTVEKQDFELKKLLDIRLYPTIRNLIHTFGVTVFLGFSAELQVYAELKKEKIFAEIAIPSSVKFYLATDVMGNLKVYLAGLVSHENLIQQLITLKFSGINLDNIPILGNTDHYQSVCKHDLLEFKKASSEYLLNKNVLIIAGCDLEDTVCKSLDKIFMDKCTRNKFSGHLTSLTYVSSRHAPGLGFIVLNLNYGEISEKQVSLILKYFNCIGIFSGSAAGYIPNDTSKNLPDIGERISVTVAKHHDGETVSLDSTSKELHLHVPTIFVETFSWLDNAKFMGARTVDVETFYILKALMKHSKTNPDDKIYMDIGVFISDYVGLKQLRSYCGVFDKYPEELNQFIQKVLAESFLSSYKNNKNSTPTFKKGYLGLSPSQISLDPHLKKEAVIEAIGKTWDVKEFFKRVHTPIKVGEVAEKDLFKKEGVPRCIHLPIKLPSSDIRIPKEYEHFLNELKTIFNFEASVNPKWNELFAYLTIDQGFVPKSNSQRVPGPHVDGIPRDRDKPTSQVIDHAYLVTNAIPTMFYTQKFDMQPYDLNKHNFFAIFRALSDESRTIKVKPFEIILMDAYSVHTPTQTEADVHRTFIRLEFSYLEFDRSGNSINPYFANDDRYPNYPFKYKPRPISENLFVPASVYESKPISNKEFVNESIDKFGRAQLRAIFINDDRYKQKRSDYKDLEKIANAIMDADVQGIVITKNGIPHAFFLYTLQDKRVCMHTLFTLTIGEGQEAMIYGINILKKISNRFATQAGLKAENTPLKIIMDENNKDMLVYFIRASQIANVQIKIEDLNIKPPAEKIMSPKKS